LVGMTALAQSDRDTLTGTVVDPTATVVPGARATAKNVEPGAAVQATATETGNYSLPSLAAGRYRVTCELDGFKATQTTVEVQVAQTIRIDLKLAAGSSADSVTLNAKAALLRAENAEPGQPLFLVDPNYHCIDHYNSPQIPNPAAWVDAPAGAWGQSSLYFSDCRWLRQASESMNFGRTFRLKEVNLSVRAASSGFGYVTNPSNIGRWRNGPTGGSYSIQT